MPSKKTKQKKDKKEQPNLLEVPQTALGKASEKFVCLKARRDQITEELGVVEGEVRRLFKQTKVERFKVGTLTLRLKYTPGKEKIVIGK